MNLLMDPFVPRTQPFIPLVSDPTLRCSWCGTVHLEGAVVTVDRLMPGWVYCDAACALAQMRWQWRQAVGA